MEDENRAATLIEKAKSAWLEIGDCQLTNWEYKSLWFSDVVVASGRPPRCKGAYRHVFVFLFDGGFCLRSVLRDRPFATISWMTNGQAIKPRQQYKYFI